jgi:hypothetical protein
MTTCPHCNRVGFTHLGKWAARDRSPVACSSCGQLAFIPPDRRSGVLLASMLLLTTVSLVAIAAKSFVVGALGIVGATAFYVWRMRAAPLERTWRAHTVAGAKVGLVASASAAFMSLFQ